MIIYILSFFVGIIYDKIQKKILNIIMLRSIKMICYTKEWHQKNDVWRQRIVDFSEWVLL